MNQSEQLCSLAVDTLISVEKIHKTTALCHNGVIGENNGKVLTSANPAK